MAAKSIKERVMERRLQTTNLGTGEVRVFVASGQEVQPQAVWETITPALAEQYLTKNVRNRRVGMQAVKRLARSMERGEWIENGESIKFDQAGSLIDGQHRLRAIILSGKPIRTLVLRGLGEQAFRTLDTGKKRSASDVIGLMGYANETALTGGLRNYYRYLLSGRFQSLFHDDPTNSELVDLLLEQPAMTESVVPGRKVATRLILARPSIMVALHYILAQIDAEDTQSFFEGLDLGAGLGLNDPILLLRQKLGQPRNLGQRYSDDMIGAFTFKAWNAYRRGESMRLLRWIPSGTGAESYPVPQ